MTGEAEIETLGVIGAGRVGQALARLALAADIRVLLAASGDPVRVGRTAQTFAAGAEPVWASDAARRSDAVILAMPLGAYDELDPADFSGRLVLDAMNYWPETDGARPEFDDPEVPTSVLVQQHLRTAVVVKAFNHVAFRDISSQSRPPGARHRIAIALAGPEDACAVVAGLQNSLGFDAVRAGSLADSRLLEPTGPVFGAVLDQRGLRRRLGLD